MPRLAPPSQSSARPNNGRARVLASQATDRLHPPLHSTVFGPRVSGVSKSQAAEMARGTLALPFAEN